ncbi:MAG TPA: hypothetical protein VKU77_10345 [Streptosporangiaceae bacterium]|nr:hypothetical protein [Streptosporangiaceae bacterium]
MHGFTPVEQAIRDKAAADTRRAAYVAGLRILADVLEAHPEIRRPLDTALMIPFGETPEGVAAMAAARRAFSGTWHKEFSGGGENTDWLNLRTELGGEGGLQVELYAPRDAVCRRVVKGTEEREVEEVVRPAETRTVLREVEIVEWECGSVLGDDAAVAAPGSVAAA